MIGSLVVELDDKNEQTSELVEIVAQQVARQLENLRLLESAERYRFEAEQSARRQTREGWQMYVESRAKEGLGYLYDLKEVRPYHNGHEDESALTLPLKARDETVGKVSVQGVAPDDSESIELANAVADRLSAHIENLRLFEETQTSLAETQSLYRINEAIGGEMDIEAIYQSVAQLSCDEMGFTGSWIAVYEPENETIRGVAGINMPEERIFASLSIDEATPGTMAAKVRQPVRVNDPVKDERMLDIPADVRARMGKALAIPVMVGDDLLGVIAATRPESSADIGTREERMLQAVATQLAIVMQRVQLFDQVQKQAERESLVNTINQKIQSATSVEAVLQIAARELGHALGAPMTIAQLSMKNQN
jgi:GAF domain-containing protein